MRHATQIQRPVTRLQRERESRRWSREELAVKAGVSAATVGYIECGYRPGGWDSHRRLSEALDVPVIDLFYADEEVAA